MLSTYCFVAACSASDGSAASVTVPVNVGEAMGANPVVSIVIESLVAFVVIDTFVPATRFKVSVDESATTLD